MSLLRENKKTWHRPSFSIGTKLKFHLVISPCGVGESRGTHMSASFIFMKKYVVRKTIPMDIMYLKNEKHFF